MVEKKESTKTSTTVRTKSTSPLHVIYVGDTILQLGLLKSTVYINSLPKRIEEAFLNVPQLKSLFVPIEKASQALIDSKTEGTNLNVVNKIVQDKFKELRRKGNE